MAEYIERERLLRKFNIDDMMNVNGTLISLQDARETLSNFTAADVATVRHGRWVCGDYYDVGDVCSECDWDSQMICPSYRYCPNCGAKMDGGEVTRKH